MTKLLTIVTFTMALGAPKAAGDSPRVWGVLDREFAEPVHVMVTPGRHGSPLTAARTADGQLVDATLRIQLWQQWLGSDPEVVPGLPSEDIWLEVPGSATCVMGAIADSGSDENGWCTFFSSPAMGGANDPLDPTTYPQVMVSGMALPREGGGLLQPPVLFNSPDINADLAVSLSDVVPFASDYASGYAFRSDLNWDGQVDLTDVVIFANQLGDECGAR